MGLPKRIFGLLLIALGVVEIIAGAILCFTVIGIVPGIILFVLGMISVAIGIIFGLFSDIEGYKEFLIRQKVKMEQKEELIREEAKGEI